MQTGAHKHSQRRFRLKSRSPQSVLSNRSGAALVEFALVAPFFLGFIIAALDFGHYAYVRSVVNGAMLKAGRDSSLESGTAANATIDANVKSQVGTVIPGATYNFTRQNYTNPTDIDQPERFDDGNGNTVRDAGECFDDYNGNGVWDAQRGRTGQGGAKAYVVYKVTVTYARLFPAMKFLGFSPNHVVESKTILANQPYTLTSNAAPSTICT